MASLCGLWMFALLPYMVVSKSDSGGLGSSGVLIQFTLVVWFPLLAASYGLSHSRRGSCLRVKTSYLLLLSLLFSWCLILDPTSGDLAALIPFRRAW